MHHDGQWHVDSNLSEDVEDQLTSSGVQSAG